MPTDNKHRLWGFGTPRLVKHMPDIKTTAAGFYAVNGTSVLRSLDSLEQERIGDMFEAIREQNPAAWILLVLDNFSSHICDYTREKAAELGIVLVFLSVASPHLQPIEPVWGKLKHDLSPISTETRAASDVPKPVDRRSTLIVPLRVGSGMVALVHRIGVVSHYRS